MDKIDKAGNVLNSSKKSCQSGLCAGVGMDTDMENTFGWPDYTVFGVVLGLSAGIGIFYGRFGSKQDTNEEFLMGNRKMAPLPVALSLLCSFLSAITLLGTPAEIYFYGTQYFMVLVAFIPMTISLTYFYVPVFFELRLTSAYEYLELRFSRGVRIAVSTISVIYLLMYMAMVVYGPSLALNQVTGINHRISVVSIFIVCTFYSTLGGIKSVVATDVLQCLIMCISTLVVVIQGTLEVGGIGYVWKKAAETNRTQFFNFDFDPRTRYTIWGSVIGEYLAWLAIYGSTQANIQRFGSIATISGVRRALIYNLIGLTLLVGLSLFGGLVIYAKYADCDPISADRVKTSDQLLPLFVMDTLGGTPGLPGLFVAGITCASLSTVSSGLNALAAVISEDFIRHYRPNLPDATMANLSKGICVIGGLISFAFTFAAELADSIFPTISALMGVTLGPTLGIFTLGMFYPWANSKGGLLGLVMGVSLVGFISIGGLVDSNLPNQKLQLSTAGCVGLNSTEPGIIDDGLYWKEQEYSLLTILFSISFLWASLIGSLSTFFFGALYSLFFTNQPNSVDRRCISPPLLSFWTKFYPEKLKKALRLENMTMETDSNRNKLNH